MIKKRYTLVGWKQIAAHFDVTVPTVQKWANDCGLPIVQAKRKCKVFADVEELERWAAAHRIGFRRDVIAQCKVR